MEDFAELAGLNLDPVLAQRVQAKLQQLSEYNQQLLQQTQQLTIQTQQDAAALKLANAKIQALTLELAHHKRLRFGKTSEAFSSEQRQLFEESVDADTAAIETEIAQLDSAPVAKRTRPSGRQVLPDHLPRIEHRHEPDTCTCPQCGKDLIKIREDISEQLDVEPARFFVHRHIRPQYACRACETITAEAIPPAVIQGSLAAPGLHAWVIIQKYLDHLPLYRIERISTRYGVPIARSTLANWVGQIGVALQPLADRLAELLRQRRILHADETPVPQLDPGNGKTKRAYLWAYRSNDHDPGPPILIFDYQPGRSGDYARRFLKDWRGHLMVDDDGGYKALFTQGITELACLAHMRRKFFDLHTANQSPIASLALQHIAELYALEQEAHGMPTQERQQLRQTLAKPKLEAFHAWLQQTRRTVADGSGTAKAIDYSLKRWTAFIRYTDHGNLPIDNNPIENAIRPIAIGKKNWLFAGSERAGQRAAAIQSLLGTAKLNGIEPMAWLKETLEKLPTWPNSRIDALLPLNDA